MKEQKEWNRKAPSDGGVHWSAQGQGTHHSQVPQLREKSITLGIRSALRGAAGCGDLPRDSSTNNSTHVAAPSINGGGILPVASNRASNSGNTVLFPSRRPNGQPRSVNLPPGTPPPPRPVQVRGSNRPEVRPPPSLIPPISYFLRGKMEPSPATDVAAHATVGPSPSTPPQHPPRCHPWKFAQRHPRPCLQHLPRHRTRLAGAPRVP